MNKKGVLYALAAYFAWGLFPIFWKLLKHVPATEIMFHRIVWAFVFYLGLVLLTGKREKLVQGLRQVSLYKMLLTSSLLISLNWYVYIYAVNSNHILQGSLGYYINPILSVFIGAVFLKEELSRKKMWAGLLCALAVLLLTIASGEVPWIALILAVSFALYGVARKKSVLDVLVHSNIELIFLLPFAIIALIYVRTTSDVQLSARDWFLLIVSGAVTGLPLLWFSQAAQRIPLIAMGFFQYIAPTLQFLCGVLLYGEVVTIWQFAAFALIWCGVSLFIYDTFSKMKRASSIQ